MPLVAINTLSTAGGGALNTYDTISNVIIENRMVAVVGTYVSGHGTAPHNAASNPRVSTGSGSVYAGNKKVARVGDLATCTHPIVGGASTVSCG